MSTFWILLELRMMEVVVTAGTIRHASSSQNVTINKPTPRGKFLIQRQEARVEN